MKKVFYIIIMTLMFLVIIIISTTAFSEAYIPSETLLVYSNRKESCDISELTTLKNNCKNEMNLAHKDAEKARSQGYEENSALVQACKQRWTNANNNYEYYSDQLVKWTNRQVEYPNATYIWRYFTKLGYNKYTIAGILGNIMAEVGGQTLAIRYQASGNGYYGMCQWNKAYSNIWGAGLEAQCKYLQDTIRYEFNTFGRNYKKEFNYDSFLKLTNERDTALAFAKCYERCASFSYGTRQNNATTALNYFTS